VDRRSTLELGYETIDHLDGYVEPLAGQVGKPSQYYAGSSSSLK
jgi:hypothetical protein